VKRPMSLPMLRTAALCAVLTGQARLCLTQTAGTAMSGSTPPAHQLLRTAPEDRPLDQWLELRARERVLGPSGKSIVARDMIGLLPVVGRYADAISYDDVGAQPPPVRPEGEHELDGFTAVDALDGIAHAVRGRQVVMINEAHPVPQHRAFTLQLLARLRREGFNWFAAETLFEEDTALVHRGYAVGMTGAYTVEPVYADLVRTAIKLGFHVVAYDSPPGIDLDPRERMQAANLVERVLKKDPHARLVVHAGYGHISKAVPAGSLIPMAIRFRELSGIDPFTIDQTRMSERSRPELEDAQYRRVAASGALTRPTVFVDAQGNPWSPRKTQFDAFVFSPRSVYEQGRPTWLRLGGLRAPYTLPHDVCGNANACLVRARLENEGADAIPVDQVIVVAGEPVPALMLPHAPCRITVEGRNRAILRTFVARPAGD
jgi:hypothetical protein